jgi:hypothetical protein
MKFLQDGAPPQRTSPRRDNASRNVVQTEVSPQGPRSAAAPVLKTEGSLAGFEQNGPSLAPADAHGRQTALHAAAAHLLE